MAISDRGSANPTVDDTVGLKPCATLPEHPTACLPPQRASRGCPDDSLNRPPSGAGAVESPSPAHGDRGSSVEPINVALRAHQAGVPAWPWQGVAADLHCWAERFIVEFKLHIGVPALLIASLHRRHLGHFRYGRNGFGLSDEIALDEQHVRHSPRWQVYGTLLHELLHSWQQRHGRPGRRNYHNREFRDAARRLGLQVSPAGVTEYPAGDTPFARLLLQHGVSCSATSGTAAPSPRRPGSKLRLYQCPCGVKVRIGRAQFRARCLDCGGLFAPPTGQTTAPVVCVPTRPSPETLPINQTSSLTL